MDAKTYCFKNLKYIVGQDFYTAASRQDAPESCKLKMKSKFPKRTWFGMAVRAAGFSYPEQ